MPTSAYGFFTPTHGISFGKAIALSEQYAAVGAPDGNVR